METTSVQASSSHKHKMFGCKHCENTWQSWSSWTSPVGFGLFCFLTSIALWVTLNALISLTGVVIALSSRPSASDRMMPSDIQQYQNMQRGEGSMMN